MLFVGKCVIAQSSGNEENYDVLESRETKIKRVMLDSGKKSWTDFGN